MFLVAFDATTPPKDLTSRNQPDHTVVVLNPLPGLQPHTWGALRGFQRAGIAFAVARRNAMLWWATGGGKTLGSAAWIVAEPGPAVILTNGAARRQFAGEIRRWTTREPFVVMPASTRRKGDETLLQYLIRTPNPVVIAGWESLHDRETYVAIHQLVYGASLVLDEAHTVKDHKRWEQPTVEYDPKTGKERTVWVRRQTIASLASWLCPRAGRRLETTATPIPNRVKDLWAQLDCLEPGSVGKYWDWARQHCGAYEGKYGMIDEGATNLGILREYVAQRAHIVGPTIALEGVPPLIRKTSTIPASELVGIDQEARTALRKAAREKGAGRDSAILEAKLIATAARKNPVVARRVADALRRGEKVLVFTGRRRDVALIHRLIQDNVGGSYPLWAADGETPADEREDIRTAYMDHEGAACIVGTGAAWGESLNLHHTDRLLITLLPWTWGQLIQWEGRVHRIGQPRECVVEYVVAEGTIEEQILAIILDKMPSVVALTPDVALDDVRDTLRGGSSDDVIAELLATVAAGGDAVDDEWSEYLG